MSALGSLLGFYDRPLFQFTIYKSELTVQYFLKTYDTYAFMAYFYGVGWISTRACKNDSLYTRDQNSLFSVLHGRLN